MVGVGVGVGVRRSVVCCTPPPPPGPVTRKKDQPFSGQALSCHLIGSAQGLQTVCAACPLLISSSFQRSPVFPRLHVQTKPVSDRRRFSLKSSSPTTLILAHKIPAGFGCFPTPSYPMISQKRALMFQCWNTHIMLRTQYRPDAADCAPSRGLDATCLPWRPGRSLPRVPCEHMELGLARMRAGERTPNESCSTPPAICPTVPVLATLLPWAETPVWLTAAHVKSRIHLTSAAFARLSHSCTQHSRPGGHKNVLPAGVRPKVRTPERVSSLLDDDGSHPQPKGHVPLSRPFASRHLECSCRASEELVVKTPHCRLCPVRSVYLTSGCVSLCNPEWSTKSPCLLSSSNSGRPSHPRDGAHYERGRRKNSECDLRSMAYRGRKNSHLFPAPVRTAPPETPAHFDGGPSISHR